MTVQIENNKRLSKSSLWKLQQEAYKQFSVAAWTQKGVPFYLTSNPYTAKLYALMTFAYFKDCASTINPDHPVYLFDLGAGSGRFSYLYLKHLLSLLERSSLNIKPCLIMTDIVPSNIDFWQRHTYLHSFFADGFLDAAYFHHSQKKPIHLIRTQKTLTPEKVMNPIVLIGNYFFDTIPQDYFRIRDGTLEEGLISLKIKTAKKTEAVDQENPNIINRLDYDYSYQAIENPENYYPQNLRQNTLLQEYSRHFDDAHFLFPTGALECLQFFEALSGNRFLLLAGDQGVCTPEQVSHSGKPKMSQHGSFSFPVNYHLLCEYFRQQGGKGLTTQFPDPAFVNFVAVKGETEQEFVETALAFEEHFDAFEPKDYWRLLNSVEKYWKLPSLDFLLYTLKLGCYDPVNFYFFFNAIRVQLSEASSGQKKFLASVIDRVWEQFFPIDQSEGDFVMNLGVLLFDIQQYEHALQYFKRSLSLFGENAKVYLNMAACYQNLEAKELFEQCIQKAKELQHLALSEEKRPPFLDG